MLEMSPAPGSKGQVRLTGQDASLIECEQMALAQGSTIIAMGSPFGALSHAHFKNHTAAGIIANAVHAEVRISWMSLAVSLAGRDSVQTC